MAATAKRDQNMRAAAIAAFALVTALGGLYASRQLHPQPAHLIRCAALESSPCLPDPAMQRLEFSQPVPLYAPPAPAAPVAPLQIVPPR